MNYEIIEDITSADIAVRVRASSLNELFRFGADALMSEMIEDVTSIHYSILKQGILEGEDLSLLYYDFLNEILFFKDAENLLLLTDAIDVSFTGNIYSCSYTLAGEKINNETHKFIVDIKAVTLHALQIYENDGLFVAESVFDV